MADLLRSLGHSARSTPLLMLLPLGRRSSEADATFAVGVVGDSSAEPGKSPASDKEEAEDSDNMNVSSIRRKSLMSVMGRFAKLADGFHASGTS